MLRIQFWKLLRNESDLHDIGQMEDEDNETAVGHHTHCFDYLRQTLLCSMDMTVEHAARSSKTGELKGYINGLDTEHSCRSRVSVRISPDALVANNEFIECGLRFYEGSCHRKGI